MNKETYLSFDALTLTGIDLLNALNSILADELQALTQRNLDEIKLCASKKGELLTDFSENTQKRTALLKSIDYLSDKQGIEFFFDSCSSPTDKALYQSNWKKLDDTLSLAIDANNVNEQVLKRNQKNLDTVLAILQGQQANNVLYDAKGDKGDYSGQSRIGKA